MTMPNAGEELPDSELRENPSERKVRGVAYSKYVKLMHAIERGETTDAELVRKKILKPSRRASSRGIGIERDDKVFHNRSTVKGRTKGTLCRIPTCDKEQSRRGFCNTHRVYARRAIKLGKVTEKNLINRGLLLPKDGGANPARAKNVPKRAVPASFKHQKRVPKRLLTGKNCLFPCCNKKRYSQGLCSKHHRIYLTKKNNLSCEKQIKLDRDLTKRQLLLPEKDDTAFEIGSKIRGIVHRL